MCKICVAMCKTMNIKSFLVVFLTLFGVLQVYAQSTQNGVVLEYHDKASKTPLSKVAVTASNASSTITDDAGKFTLNFRTLKAGDGIQFRRIEKSGYEVMNREAVEVMRIGSKSNAAPLQIVLCSSALLNQLRDGYRSVSVKRYETQLKKAEAEAKRLKEAGKLKEEEYNAKLDEIEAEYEEKLSSIDTYIDRFARIDLTELDDIERQIISLVQEGKFDEAMTMYEKQDFVQKLQKSREEQRQLAEAKTKIESAIDAKAEEAEKLRQSIERQVNLLRMAGGKENLEKVHEILKEVFLADELDIYARKNYANSLHHKGENKEAFVVLKKGIELATSAEDKAMLAIDVAYYKDFVNDLEQSIVWAHKSDSLAKVTGNTNYKMHTRVIPMAAHLLLKAYMETGMIESCKPLAENVEKVWDVDSLDISSLTNHALLLKSLGDYYPLIANHERMITTAEERIKLDEFIYSKAQWASNKFDSYASAASTYQLEGKKEQAIHYAQLAVQCLAEFLEKAPLQTNYMSAMPVFYTAVDVLNDFGMWEESAQMINKHKELKTYERLHVLEHEGVEQYESFITFGESVVALNCGDTQKAEQLVDRAFNILGGEDESESVAVMLRAAHLGRIRQYQKYYKEADQDLALAISIASGVYEDEPDAQNADIYCRMLVWQADLKAEMGQKNVCKKLLKQAEKVAAFECDKIKINETKKKYNIR